MSVGALTENGDTVTADVTANGTFTAVGTFTPTGGAGENLAVITTADSVSAEITAEMRATGGIISITATLGTATDTVTYNVAKVYTINLSDLTYHDSNDTVTGTVTTNNTTFTPSATLRGITLNDNAFTITGNTLTVDVRGCEANDELVVTVTCDTDNSKTATKTLILSDVVSIATGVPSMLVTGNGNILNFDIPNLNYVITEDNVSNITYGSDNINTSSLTITNSTLDSTTGTISLSDGITVTDNTPLRMTITVYRNNGMPLVLQTSGNTQ